MEVDQLYSITSSAKASSFAGSARFALRWELRFNVKRGGKNATAHFY
jgi:hypothetical protein